MTGDKVMLRGKLLRRGWEGIRQHLLCQSGLLVMCEKRVNMDELFPELLTSGLLCKGECNLCGDGMRSGGHILLPGDDGILLALVGGVPHGANGGAQGDAARVIREDLDDEGVGAKVALAAHVPHAALLPVVVVVEDVDLDSARAGGRGLGHAATSGCVMRPGGRRTGAAACVASEGEAGADGVRGRERGGERGRENVDRE